MLTTSGRRLIVLATFACGRKKYHRYVKVPLKNTRVDFLLDEILCPSSLAGGVKKERPCKLLFAPLFCLFVISYFTYPITLQPLSFAVSCRMRH